MPNLYFIRHAKTTLNKEGRFAGRTDCDVTPEGIEMARRAFNYKDEDFEYIYVSPLKRTRQTLDAIMPKHKEPIVDQRIIERDLGEWESVPYSNFSDSLIENYVKGYYEPPKSEPIESVRRRVLDFVDELFTKYDKNTRILIVSHNGVLRQIRDAFLPDMKKEEIKNSQLLKVTNEDYEKYINNRIETREIR